MPPRSSPPPATPPLPRPRGRPRDGGLDVRILDAALGLMAARGFEGMTMEAVAREAGVPRPTVYRRWSSKADLATAALARLQAGEPPLRGRTARARLVEERRHPELVALFRRRVVTPRRRMVRAALERGVAAGALRADADLDAAVNLLVGSFYARHLTGEPVPRDWPERVVAVMYRGLRARPPRAVSG